jgi:hypothetical protein
MRDLLVTDGAEPSVRARHQRKQTSAAPFRRDV